MKHIPITVEKIDAVLPQTQCKECGYDGCLPYATALHAGTDTIDKCPPGGLQTLQQLGELLNIDITPYSTAVHAQTRPPQVVYIDEDACIGCTKCIQACPVDAIVGAAKLMHTVIKAECTGCELCIEPCPVDCIYIESTEEKPPLEQQQFSNDSRQRYQQHQQRKVKLHQQRRQKHLQAKKQAQQSYITDAIARVKQKREQR